MADVWNGLNRRTEATSNITAKAGGGQTSGVQLTARINHVSVCATTGDSVVLPGAAAPDEVIVINNGAQSLNVFPAVGDSINALAVNSAFAVAANKVAHFVCGVNGKWQSNLTA